MQFDAKKYKKERLSFAGETITFRAYQDLIYVDKPVDREYQKMNIFVPEVYYDGGKIDGYTLDTAPIFMPNTVGGYMPGPAGEPGYGQDGALNSIFRALMYGYVVAAPAIRGRVCQDEQGRYTGKAPACIVDYKAAVRYLREFAADIPGDKEKIVTNGTSAGGALSSLMGATGNRPDYEPYLKEIGAAVQRDDIFAASCYCPITNLEHADMAYEWQFDRIYDFHRSQMQLDEGGRPSFSAVDGTLTDSQIQLSQEEKALFPAYVNSLGIKAEGEILQLDQDGEGSLKDYVISRVLESAQRALDQGVDVADKEWLTVEDGKAVAMDFKAYNEQITRMKGVPAFDAIALDSPENDLFGSETVNYRHFTPYSLEKSAVAGSSAAEAGVVKMLNPMNYIEDEQAVTTSNWRIRHGEADRDTSLAISALLTAALQQHGCRVDYHLPWELPHSGDYDLDELFARIDGLA